MEVKTPGIDSKPYLRLRFSQIAVVQLGLTSFLLLCAAVNVNKDTPFALVVNHKRTIWSFQNYKINADGEKYYNYTDPETGQIQNQVPSQPWYDMLLGGRYVYMFGANRFETFCYPRLVPLEEWFRSVYRASQLTPWVQVPLKAAILFTMTFRIISTVFVGCLKTYKEPESRVNKCFTWIILFNETFHNTTLFMVANYLRDPDRQYIYVLGPTMVAAYASFFLKMLLSFWHTGANSLTFIRIILVIILSSTFSSNYKNILLYQEHNFCDNYTLPWVGFYEWAAIICLWAADLLDTVQCSDLELVVHAIEDSEQEMDGPLA